MTARRSLALQARAALDHWQGTLPPVERAELRGTGRRDSTLALVAVPVDAELAREHEMWTTQLLEYINGHEETHFFLAEFVGHICRAHPAARRVIETGTIPADFACPRGEVSCPFARASARVPGQALLLTLDDTVRRGGS